MKVLAVTNMWPTESDRACGIFVREQVESLRALGVSLDVLHIDGRARTSNYFRGFGRVRAAVRDGDYDLLHAHHVLSGAVAVAQRRLPIVLTHHGVEVLHGWQAPLCWSLSRRVREVIVASDEMKQRLGMERVLVIPSGVDFELFRPVPRAEARERLGLPQDRALVLFVGIPRPEKRFDLVQAAVGRLQAKGVDADLVHVAGKFERSQVPLHMNACDVLVLASDWEGSPMVVKEALACDLPVVSVHVGDVASIIGDVRGCHLARRCPDDIAEKLRAVLETRERVRGRERVRDLSLEGIARQVMEVYESALASGPGRRPVQKPATNRLAGKRICVVRAGYFPEDPRVRREVAGLVESGARVDVVCLRGKDEPARDVAQGARIYRMPLRHRRRGPLFYVLEYGWSVTLAWAWVTWLQLRHRYTVVQANSMPDALVFAALVPKLMGARVLLDLHELMPELYASKFGVSLKHPLVRLVRAAEKASTRFAHHVLTVSAPTRKALEERGVPPEKLTTVMNAPDPRLFDAARGGRNGRPHGDGFTVMSHGTLVERYGFDLLVEAMVPLRSRVPGVRLRIAGEGQHEPELRRLVETRKLGGQVEFLGFQPLSEISEVIRQADVGVVANRADVFTDFILPTKLMEYVAMGIPTVAPRSPAIEEYFSDRAISFFRAGDAEDLARAVLWCWENREQAEEMAEQARREFYPEHSWPRSAEKYLKVMSSLCSRP